MRPSFRAAAAFTGALATLLAATSGCTFSLEELLRPFVDFSLSLMDRTGPDVVPPHYKPIAFVNWETPHVSPLALSPNRQTLLAVNTPDARVEIFDVAASGLRRVARVPVGLDPVSVRFNGSTEAWVVNHVSDSVSVVDVAQRAVVRTLHPGDEPTDVAFASGRAFVVCSQANHVAVYDLASLDAAPVVIPIAGEDPRAIQPSADGRFVHVAIFESGNGTTILRETLVSDPNGPYGGANPIPSLDPEMDAGLADAPPAGLIVRKDRATGRWLDENGADWSAFVTWDLLDHDVATIDAQTLDVSYASGLMNLDMHLAARTDGVVAVVGTEATNHVRFEPRLAGTFVRSVLALVDPRDPSAARVVDLNPHLAGAYDDGTPRVSEALRRLSIADPRGIVWQVDGAAGFITGQGSNNVIRVDRDGERTGHVAVGAGPTGIVLDEVASRLYVLNRFDASVSVLDAAALTEVERIAFPDPTPAEIRAGRPFLYDAHVTSGLGVTACAACHVDARMDQLAWDLGNPAGATKPFNQNCDALVTAESAPLVAVQVPCRDFHPVKGPLTTQTLQGIIGTEPLHWRGDRDNLAEFNAAFESLNGRDAPLTDAEVDAFERFIATLRFPPNPFRTLENAPSPDGPGGDALRGESLFVSAFIDGRADALAGLLGPFSVGLNAVGPVVTCNRCHHLPVGTNQAVAPGALLLEPQDLKVPQLRNVYEKTGFDKDSRSNHRGFGFAHDGGAATLHEFLSSPVFDFGSGPDGDQRRRDVIAFVFSLSTDTHAAVGQQVTLRSADRSTPEQQRLDLLLAVAARGQVGLMVHVADEPSKAYASVGSGPTDAGAASGAGAIRLRGVSDGAEQNSAVLRDAASTEHPQTWTLTPLGSQERLARGAE